MKVDRLAHASFDTDHGRLREKDRTLIAEVLKRMADSIQALAPADPSGSLVCANMRQVHAILDSWVGER